jgi:hypothetical protein
VSCNDKEWRTVVMGLKKIFSAALGISEVECFKHTFYKRVKGLGGKGGCQSLNLTTQYKLINVFTFFSFRMMSFLIWTTY